MRRRYLPLFSLVLALLLLASPSRPATAQTTALTLYDVNPDSFPDVTVFLSAQDGTRPIKGLDKDDFTLVEDGKIIPVQDVQPLEQSEIPISLILVLDVSLSMQANNGITGAQAAALRILDRLREKDRVALIAFSEGINRDPAVLAPGREINFTENKDLIRAAINGLTAEGGTALYDATMKGLQMSRGEPRGSRAMILLTDGRDERFEGDERRPGSVATDGDVMLETLDIPMPIYTIGLGTGIDTNFLDRLATQSGGRFQEAPSGDQLEALFNEALDQLLQRYVLLYQSGVTPDTATHSLLVQLETPQHQASMPTTFTSKPPEVPGILLDYQDNEEVTGLVRIRPTIFAKDPITNVELLVDDQLLASDVTPPYVLTWRTDEARWLDPAAHTILVRATDEGGDVGERAITLLVQPPPPPPITLTPDPITPTPDDITPTPTPGEDIPPPSSDINWLPWALLLVGAVLVVGVPLAWQRQRQTPQPVDIPAPPVPILYNDPPFPSFPEPSEPMNPTARDSTRLDSRVVDGPRGDIPADATLILGRRPQLLAYLVELDSDRQGRTHQIQANRVEIGRGPRAQVKLDDPSVGRQQAVILHENGQFFIHDLASSNPTRLNGQVVAGRASVQDRDIIQVGKTRLQFVKIDPATQS